MCGSGRGAKSDREQRLERESERNGLGYTSSEGEKEANKKKNRYGNVMPCTAKLHLACFCWRLSAREGRKRMGREEKRGKRKGR